MFRQAKFQWILLKINSFKEFMVRFFLKGPYRMTKTLVKAEAHIWQFFQPTPILIWPFVSPPLPSPAPNLGIQATLSSMGSPAKAAAYGLRRPALYSRAIVEL